MKIAVAIVEDNRDLLESLRKLVNDTAELDCVATCPDGETALRRLPPLRPDVVLMDIALPGMSGVDCIRQLKPLLPQTQVMMLTVLEDYDQIFQSLRAGATGYLLKDAASQKLVESIRDLHAGGSPMSNSIARKVVVAFRELGSSAGPESALSLREEEVLRRLARGHRYKEIAAEPGVAADTVRTHVQNIYKKLHVHSKAEAVRRLKPNPPPS